VAGFGNTVVEGNDDDTGQGIRGSEGGGEGI